MSLNITSKQTTIKLGPHKSEEMNVMKVEHYSTVWKRKISNIKVNHLLFQNQRISFSLDLVTKFADELISSWTIKQAKVVYHSILFLKSQKDMAEDLGMTRQNFNFHWGTSKTQLILDYIEYFKILLAEHNSQ